MTNKLKYFIANWKMYGDLKSLKSINKVINFVNSNKKKKIQIIYCPPYTLLYPFSKKIKNTYLELGAQNCHPNIEYGAFTGSVNPRMIKSLGAKYVIIGHSENRANGDTDQIINKKIHSALKSNLTVIFCIGETLAQKRKKITMSTLKIQIKKGLKGLKKNSKIIFAYEPIWSIGTGLIPNNPDLLKNIIFIKKFLKNNIKFKNIKVIYGGSVSPNNIKVLNAIDEIDGYLIGGSSQNSKKLIDIVKKTFK